MSYEKELNFVCKVLSKRHIPITFADANSALDDIVDEKFKSFFSLKADKEVTFNDLFEKETTCTVFRVTNYGGMCYMIFLLPQRTREAVCVIGPFAAKTINTRQLFEYGEKYGVHPNKLKTLSAYYEDLIVITESSDIYLILDTFWEHIWGNRAFRILDVNQDMLTGTVPLTKQPVGEIDDAVVNMEIMEKRYAYENELMRAVAQGHVHKLPAVFENFAESVFESRSADPLRNLKNYCIIMNTLLRKAAEQGGVHPLYLDDISTSYAVKIEQISSVASVREFMSEMYRAYCRLVRKYSMRNYSTTVQKVIVRIDSDLSSDLSLVSLAKQQNISPGYLSTVFKKETGKTITEYIINERMQLAMHLLKTTRLQIQTVALHCGIDDVQYFSKIFKKNIGMTPKEYRKSAH